MGGRPPTSICRQLTRKEFINSGAFRCIYTPFNYYSNTINIPSLLRGGYKHGLCQQQQRSVASYYTTPHWLQDLEKCKGENVQNNGLDSAAAAAAGAATAATVGDGDGLSSAAGFAGLSATGDTTLPPIQEINDEYTAINKEKENNEEPIHSRHHPLVKHFLNLKGRRKYRQVNII